MLKRRRFTAPIVHAIRVSCVASLLLLIPKPDDDRQEKGNAIGAPSIELIQQYIPAADRVDPAANGDGTWQVFSKEEKRIATVARTLPTAKDVVGYRGPTEAMILVDGQQNVIGVSLLRSDDTEEHVQAVRENAGFFEQFQSWKWGTPPGKIDGVSGATLTSLALAAGVMTRMGDAPPSSLVFPETGLADDLGRWFDGSNRFETKGDLIMVLDKQGNSIGSILRTGPLSDTIVGYQGPTELLVKLETASSGVSTTQTLSDRTIADIKIRNSYDNQPYVGYCKTEYGFWGKFKGKSLGELSKMNLEQAGIEGVSGATMTSLAIGDTLIDSSRKLILRDQQRLKALRESKSLFAKWKSLGMRWTIADVFCVLTILSVPIFQRFGWYRVKRLRLLWLLFVVGIIGLWSGNLVSMALIAGWGAQGIAWRLAPALAAISVTALLSPGIGKSNPYCNHLCPHGALQQLVRPNKRSRRFVRLPRRLTLMMSWVPGSLLVVAYLMLLFRPSTDLSSWEPFHGYLFRYAPWTAILFALLTLGFSALIPMGFCRLGCPTGRLLDYLRRSATSDRLKLGDAIAVLLLIIAGVWRTVG